MVSVPLWAYKKSELINSSDFILSGLAQLTGHGTITWVAGYKTGQMRHETPYSESVLFKAVFRT